MSDVRLIVLRGNSGSGKTSVSLALQRAYGRGVAWVSQDMMRRQVLRELDHPGARNVGLIDLAVRYALESGYHVVLDGILRAARYEDMLAGCGATTPARRTSTTSASRSPRPCCGIRHGRSEPSSAAPTCSPGTSRPICWRRSRSG